MKSKRNKNGFIIFILNLLFVAIGVFILIIELLRNRPTLAAIVSFLKKPF